MIVDKLEYLALYKNIPDCVINFVSNLDCNNLSLGRQNLSDDVYVNIERYTTKYKDEAKFEAHKKYIDIQIVLQGCENIYTTNISGLSTLIHYEEDRDIIFYSDDVSLKKYITLDGTNFVMLFPHEAHAPQIAPNDNKSEVLKVVIKIKI